MDTYNNTYPKTYIAPGMVLKGSISSAGDVEVAGCVDGDIFSQGTVILRNNVRGNITTHSLLLVDCTLRGDLSADGRVEISAGSTVEGTIQAGELLCAGTIRGNVTVGGDSTMESTSWIEGDVETTTLSMIRGAHLCGRLTMGTD